jgi:hypothetical protein
VVDSWIAILVIGGLLFLWGYGDSMAASEKVAERIREMLHKERLAALEKGLPAPAAEFDEALLAYLADGAADALDGSGGRRRARAWAIALILGGIGWAVATLSIPLGSQVGWLRDTYSFGVIPVLLGAGVLLHVLTRRD